MVTKPLLLALVLVAVPAAAAPEPAAGAQPASPARNGLLPRKPNRAPATSSAPQGPDASGGRGGKVDPLERFAPRPVDPVLSRRVQAMLDVRAPGLGIPSEDGQRLFFSWTVTGVSQVWRLDGPERFPVQLTGGEEPTAVVGLTRDGKTLVVQRERAGEGSTGLYLLSAEGGPLQEVTRKAGVRAEFELLSADDRWIYFTANDLAPGSRAVYRQDLSTGARETLVAVPGVWSISDARDDGTLLLRKATGALTSEHWQRDPAGALTPVLGQGEATEWEVAYAAAPGELLVLTNRYAAVRRLYRLAAGVLYPVSPDLRWDVDAFGIDRARTRIHYGVNEGGRRKLTVLDARTLSPHLLPRLAGAEQLVAGPGSRSGRFLTLGVDGARAPRASYLIDWQSNTYARWVLPSAPEVDPGRFAVAEPASYPARDGTQIPVLVRRPERCAADPCPVVIGLHGPGAQASPGFDPAAQLFVDEGFVLVEPDVRGSGGYGKAWRAADDGPRRLEVITDVEDAARWARRAFASKDGRAPRVGVIGEGHGGYLALYAMSRFAGAYDAGVSIGGVIDLVAFLENAPPDRRAEWIREYGDPARDRDLLVKLSPRTYDLQVKGPLLLLQGASDPRTPVGEAVQLHDALVARQVPVELVLLPGAGDQAERREARAYALGKTLAFLKRYLVEPP